MRFKINGKYEEVAFLSFLKGWILSWAVVTGIIFFILVLIGVFLA